MRVLRSRKGIVNHFFAWSRMVGVCAVIFFSMLILNTAIAQEKQLVQVKAYNEQLHPIRNLEISLNGKEYVKTDNKGVVFVELEKEDLPVNSVGLKDPELEAASWNHGKGILEIIIRKKTYKIVSIGVRDTKNNGIKNLKITFQGEKIISAVTNDKGVAEFTLPLAEKVVSAEQFKVNDDFNVDRLQSLGDNYILHLKPVQIEENLEKVEEPVIAETIVPSDEYFLDFDISKLDSIKSLTVFYAIFKSYQIEELDPEVKQKVDAKFTELVGQLQDSLRKSELAFIGKISDTTYVRDDISNLLEQAKQENHMLVMQKDDFEKNIEIINEKLAKGFQNLDAGARAGLLEDLNLLEQLLAENESRFYRNQNNYRQIVTSMKEKFFDMEDLENKLILSEAQRVEEQKEFRQKIVATLIVVAFLAILIVILMYFSSKLKKQKEKLSVANAEITRINSNLEEIVNERTRMLLETNKELDTVLYRASHDLRSPIRSILGLCNLATGFSDGESKELLKKVVQTTFEMDKLLKKLSVISEINQPNEFTTINIADVIQNIREGFDPMIKDYKVNFVVDCPEDLTVVTNPNLVEVILSNLIDNALFYSILKNPQNSQVELKAAVVNDQLEVSIFDNGIGVDSDISDKLFEMFFRGNENSKGNGLGLYIVQKSVHALNGTVEVQSEPGKFARFVIHLPLNSQEKIEVKEYDEMEATPA